MPKQTNDARRAIRVDYSDGGILLSYPGDQPGSIRQLALNVDDALSLAGAIEDVTDRNAVDESTKTFRVQWFDDGVLLSYRVDGQDWTRVHFAMTSARIVADAIRRCVSARDVLVIHDDDVEHASADDFA